MSSVTTHPPEGHNDAVGLEESAHRGILPLFLNEATRRGQAIDAIEAEASWILDDNQPMRAVMKEMGSDVYRRWRLYEKPIATA